MRLEVIANKDKGHLLSELYLSWMPALSFYNNYSNAAPKELKPLGSKSMDADIIYSI